MNLSLRVPILLSLSLIGLAQITFFPVYISIIFLLMLVALFWHSNTLKKQPTYIFPKMLIAGLVLVALAAIYFSFQSFLGVEAGTAFLTTFLYAKALEGKNKRDVIVLFNFALFVSASLFLHSQSIWMALLVICCLISCFWGLYRVQSLDFNSNHATRIQSVRADLKDVAKTVALAVPFFIVLFMFVPRFQPLWQIPISSQKGVTGISDQMSPGDIAELSQSSELAFRVVGNLKNLPPQQDLYWRAMVLDQYDGATWTRHGIHENIQQNPLQYAQTHLKTQAVEYQYLAADARQKWIAALEYSIPNERRFSIHQDYAITPNRLVQRHQPISLLWIGREIQNEPQTLSMLENKLSLTYQAQTDIQAQKLAQKLFKDSGLKPESYLRNVLKWYQQQNFSYTLKPDLLGEHRVDQFLFKTRQGFCEHYASSFVMLMRYVGIPARVVVGYQGGQAAPDGKSWEVRQLDAHAWTEVFISGKWQRIDPTAMIAPQRLDWGMQTYMSNERTVFGDEQFSALHYQQFSVLTQLRVWSDYASFQWQNKIVGYDTDKQKKWMSLLGLSSNYALGLLLITAISIIGLMYFIVSKLKVFSGQSKQQRLINAFNKGLAKAHRKYAYESFQAWIERLARNIEHKKCFLDLIRLHHQIIYLNQSDKLIIKQFEKLIKDCATELKGRKSTCQDSEK